jgi:hypothetical protein
LIGAGLFLWEPAHAAGDATAICKTAIGAYGATSSEAVSVSMRKLRIRLARLRYV